MHVYHKHVFSITIYKQIDVLMLKTSGLLDSIIHLHFPTEVSTHNDTAEHCFQTKEASPDQSELGAFRHTAGWHNNNNTSFISNSTELD